MNDDAPPRGGHVLDAAVRLIATEGLAGLSIRAVATEAGVSLAQVQYYFRSKDDLVAAAFEHASDQFLARLMTVLERPRSRRRLRAAIDLWLPLDQERESWVKVWLAFIGTAATRPELAEAARRIDQQVISWLTAELTALHVPDPTTEATRLLALIDGTALHALTLPPAARPTYTRTTLTPYFTALAELGTRAT